MSRTGMIARGLRGTRRMALGRLAEVYVLAKALDDTLEAIGSTSAASQREEGGEITLTICEDSTLDETAMARAAAFALATESEELNVFRKISAMPPVGCNNRSWSFKVEITGTIFENVQGSFLLLANGTDFLLLTSGDKLELANG